MADSESHDGSQKLPRSVYLVGSLTRFAQGMYQPFTQAYMIDMGASFAELGAFRAVGNAAPTILQPVWGAKSDQIGRRKPFVAFGTLTGFFTVFLFLFAVTPVQMIVLFGIQSLLLSIQIPTWLSLIGGLMDESNRGDELGKLGRVTDVVSLIATLVSGFIAGLPVLVTFLRSLFGGLGEVLLPVVDPSRAEYYLPFYLTAVIGIAASLLSLKIKERPPDSDKRREFPPLLQIISKPGNFRRLCAVTMFFSFSMAMAWPYFAVVQRDFLGFSLFEFAIASAIMTSVSAILTLYFGRLSDRVGRKPLIVFGRGILFVVPLIYALAPDALWIYIANAIAGVSIASSFNAITAYIYDIAPEEERGSYLAVYNTFSGIVFLFGSLIAGLLGDALVPFIGWYLGAITMLLVSTALRFVSSFFYALLKEPRDYDSSIWKELNGLIGRRRVSPEDL
ncbi:MAG: MFS transporter [Candidatus Thorarchaeota archaeon]|nr:MAG: MFS transporter [Candidatus Thorarchaeota archaeon]